MIKMVITMDTMQVKKIIARHIFDDHVQHEVNPKDITFELKHVLNGQPEFIVEYTCRDLSK